MSIKVMTNYQNRETRDLAWILASQSMYMPSMFMAVPPLSPTSEARDCYRHERTDTSVRTSLSHPRAVSDQLMHKLNQLSQDWLLALDSSPSQLRHLREYILERHGQYVLGKYVSTPNQASRTSIHPHPNFTLY